ncbi:peptidoglycan -binding protein [Roseovarius aestuarii]|uniref:Motility protein B n=1 Tax=Roseovarius aestuarii TaxID=475083 RepID=A0A1X7BY55_9RHOB|nr:peptidoglycan -binding protein [Roseovarius aestuarii]SMC14528.1 Motility protein B [Roseovarius aestuarii]
MALSRRTGARFQASIWPGFVDAMTGLLLVLMFVLTIFMVVQFVLRETISGQESKLDALSAEVAALAQALGLEQDRSASFETRVGELTATLSAARQQEEAQAAQIASFEEQVAGLLAQRDKSIGQIADLEGARDALISEREALQLALAGLRDEVDAQAEAARLSAARRAALDALVADLRRRNTETQEALGGQVAALEAELSEAEKTRLAEAAAAQALREKLQSAEAELTAMTLALEEQRRQAEETLAMLAAARTAGDDLDIQLAAALLAQEGAQTSLIAAQDALNLRESELTELRGRLSALEAEAVANDTAAADQAAANEVRIAELDASLTASQAELKATQKRLAEALAAQQSVQAEALDAEEVRKQLAAALAAKLAAESEAGANLTRAEERAALLAQTQAELSDQQEIATEAQRQQALLNRQVAALREQLSGLQGLLDDAKAREAAADIQLQTLGRDLNTALARVAAEERRARELEEEKRLLQEERLRLLEAEKQDLERYRSEFFGRLRDVLGAQEGVRIVGDRFVFSSEVLFPPGEARLSSEGQIEIAKVTDILGNVANEIPQEIDWVLQVDGHTDDVPVGVNARFRDNWELSQARALSVVRYMIDVLGMPPDRLSANGFGQYQPINPADSDEARAQNRRIELKFTGK